MDVWTTIKVLRNRGMSIRKIAKQLRISRNTVRKYLAKYGNHIMSGQLNTDVRANGRIGRKR